MPYNRAEGLAWLNNPYVVHSRFEVYDGVSKWQNMGNHAAEDWFRGADWGGDIDTPIVSLKAELALKIGDKRLSPLIVRTLDVSRAVQLKIALAPPGTPIQDVKSWRRAFVGFIDDIDVSPDGNTLTLACSDRASLLRDTFIEEPDEKRRIFGRKPKSVTDPGISRELVMQELLKTFSRGNTELVVPVASGSYVQPYLQTRTSVWQALQEHALQIGWDLRFRWFMNDSGLGTFKLVFQEPGRGKVGADYRFALKDFISLKPVKLSLPDIRNVVEVTYRDTLTKSKETVQRMHIDSLERYNRRYMAMQEEASSIIDTKAEAERLVASVLADLAYPKAVTGFERLFWPYVELGDVVQLEADYITFDVEPELAVTSYRNTLQKDKERTEVSLRDQRPAAAHTRWLERQAGVKGVDVPVPILPGNRPYQKEPPVLTTATRGARDNRIAYLDVTWDEDPRGISEYLNLRWRIVDSNDGWTTGSTELGATRTRIPEVDNERTYEVQIQVVSPNGTAGLWSESAKIESARDTIPPEPVTGLSFQPAVGADTHPAYAVLKWDRSSARDFSYTKVEVAHVGGSFSNAYHLRDADIGPANLLYYTDNRNRWPLPDEQFIVRIRHIDEAGNESGVLEAGPVAFNGSGGAVPGVVVGPVDDGNADPGAGGGGEGETDGDPGTGGGGEDPGDDGGTGGGTDVGEVGTILPGAVMIDNKYFITAPTAAFDEDNVSSAALGLLEKMRSRNKIGGTDEVEVIRAWNGKSGFENRGGQYPCCRKLREVALSNALAFMASGDLLWLDYMCYAWELYENAMEGPGTRFGDRSGPGTSSADGYRGITWGTSGRGEVHSDTTNKQIELEDGVVRVAHGVIYYFCRKNQSRYSPTKEPSGNRPSVPGYYKKIADSVKRYEVEDYRPKWDKYWRKDEARRAEVGGAKKHFSHPMNSEAAGLILMGLADGGKDTQDYKDGVRIVKDIFLGDEYDGGQKGSIRWCKTPSGDAVYWGQYLQKMMRYYESVGGVRTVKYTRSTQFTQLGTYLNETWGSLDIIKKITGDDILSDHFMESAARTAAISVLDPKLTKDGKWAKNMSNDGTVLPDTWFDGPGIPYDSGKWISSGYGILAPYDRTGRIAEVTDKWWAKEGRSAKHDGGTTTALNYLLVQGKVRA